MSVLPERVRKEPRPRQYFMEHRALLVLTTVPDAATAERIAQVLVEARLAACVNVLPGVESIYRWQGAVTRSAELQLLIKTTTERYSTVEEAIRMHHPYDVPEVIAVPIDAASSTYLRWLFEETREAPTFLA